MNYHFILLTLDFLVVILSPRIKSAQTYLIYDPNMKIKSILCDRRFKREQTRRIHQIADTQKDKSDHKQTLKNAKQKTQTAHTHIQNTTHTKNTPTKTHTPTHKTDTQHTKHTPTHTHTHTQTHTHRDTRTNAYPNTNTRQTQKTPSQNTHIHKYTKHKSTHILKRNARVHASKVYRSISYINPVCEVYLRIIGSIEDKLEGVVKVKKPTKKHIHKRNTRVHASKVHRSISYI